MAKRNSKPIVTSDAVSPRVETGAEQKFVVFRCGNGVFAFAAEGVGEVLRLPRLVHMPLAPKSLLGLANLRGQVLPVVSVAKLLGLSVSTHAETARVIVAGDHTPVGFAIDSIDALMSLPVDRIETGDASAGTIDPEFLDGVVKTGEGRDTITILNPARMLDREFSRMAAASSRAGSVPSAAAPIPSTAAPTQRRVSLVSFELRHQEYAVPLDSVREIIQLPPQISEVPRAETAVLGVVTLRDRLLPLVSLRALLGLPAGEDSERRGKVVVLSVGRGSVGVVADRTREILHVDPDAIDPAPALLTRGAGEAEIASICRLDHGKRLVALLSPDRLFRSEVMKRAVSDQASETKEAGETNGNAMAEEQFVIFRLGEQEYGMPIAAVQEIARTPEHITKLPKAPAFIDGVMNLRGTVVPIVDLRRRFDIASKEQGGAQRILVLALGGRQTGFMVDGVSEVLRVPDSAISTAPDLSAEQMRLIGRVANLDAQGRMILLTDPAQLLDQVEADVLAKFDPGNSAPDIEGLVIRLLIADDSALVRKLLEGIFEEEGDFDIRLARDGAAALALVKSFDPHVVTLDVQMPGVDGLACLSQIMIEAPRPVVMISALTEEGAEATLQAMELGATDFVAKPSGTVSLEIETLRPLVVQKVRAAASVRISKSLRLRERIRHQFRGQDLAAELPTPRAPFPKSKHASNGLVLIGTSTGGPAALDIVLPQLPRHFPWPVMVAQHMPAAFTAAFAKRLDRQCQLAVVEVSRPIPLQAGTIYIGRGDADLVVAARPGGLMAIAAPAQRDYPWHPSTERMVTSALDHYSPAQLIGVLMTGMGNDGAPAMTRLFKNGGHTIAEAESTAAVWGMPGELVKNGGAEFVHPVDEIASAILSLVGVHAAD